MYTNEIYNHLRQFCTRLNAQFDVIPCDQLDTVQIIKYPLVLVVNTDPSTRAGSHWTSIFIKNKWSPIEFYDSYGLGIKSYAKNFEDFVNRLGRPVQKNVVQLQSCDSEVCGHYAVYFLYMRINNYAPKLLYCKFSKNYKQNDMIVFNFIKSKCYLLSHRCFVKNEQCCKPFCK